MPNNFTPGPWEYRTGQSYDWGWVTTATGEFIAQAKDPRARDDRTLDAHRVAKTDPWEANARLIAAAPKMLEALTACQTALAMMTEPDEIKRSSVLNAWTVAVAAEAKARQAISLARGEGLEKQVLSSSGSESAASVAAQPDWSTAQHSTVKEEL